MNNNFYTNVNPYMQQISPQDQQGLNPVFQNIGAQQANQNAAMQQGMNLTNQAGMTVDGKQAGAGQIAMANALRKNNQPTQNQINAKDVQMGGLSTYNPMTQYDISQQYGTDPYSQSSRMLAAQERGF
jgi:hypothetical protein